MKVGYSLFETFKRWDKEMTDNWLTKESTRPIVLIHLHMYVSLIDILTLKMLLSHLTTHYPKGLNVLYPALRKAQSSFAPDTGINLCQDPELATNPSPFLLLDKSQLSIWVTFSQPTLCVWPSNIIHLSIYIFIFRHAYWGGCKSNLHIRLI